MASVGLAEGIGILLLLPLLQIAGVSIAHGNVDRISAPLRNAFAMLGIPQTLVFVLVAYAVVTIAEASLVRAQTILNATVVHDFAQRLRDRLYGAIAQADWLTLSRIRSSDFTFALTTAADRSETAAHQLLFFTASAVVAIVYTVMAIVVSPAMSATVLGLGLILLVAQKAKTFGSVESGEELTRSTNELFATASEHLAALKLAKSYNSEARHVALFHETGMRLNRASLALVRSYASLKCHQTVGSVVGLCLILYLALVEFHLGTAAILLLLFLFSRLASRLGNLQQTLQFVVGTTPAFRAIQALIDQCSVPGEHESVEPRPVVGCASLRNVSFSYGGEGGAEALSNVSLDIPAGRTVAIVGPSGSGKTTLADVLLGLIQPDSGVVTVGSEPLDAAHIESWRRQIGYVTQDTFLFNDTVRANLEWAQPGATEAEMREALTKAAARDFVDSLQNGIDTVVGERGVRLSGGEKQRISLARALLRTPRLLILDEATSAIDSENEERIYNAIERLHGEVTILVITHRLSTIRSADIIHVLDQGSIVASGTWASLMKDGNPRFRDLCAAQGIAG